LLENSRFARDRLWKTLFNLWKTFEGFVEMLWNLWGKFVPTIRIANIALPVFQPGRQLRGTGNLSPTDPPWQRLALHLRRDPIAF
jgi:hypothetical protein